MTGAAKDAVIVRDDVRGERPVPFDYLVLAVGSTYAEPVKPTQAEPTLAERQSSWNEAAAKLAAARSVIIVGAGPVGVELAGEILTVYPHKKVTFVDMASSGVDIRWRPRLHTAGLASGLACLARLATTSAGIQATLRLRSGYAQATLRLRSGCSLLHVAL